MARSGRKRKWGARDRSGHLKRKRKPKKEQNEERVRIARNQPHRRELKSNDRISELAESSLGRLNLRGMVSAGERAAGEAFAAIVGSYRTVIEGPRPMRSLMPETASEHLQSPDDQNVAPKFDCPSRYADPVERRVQLGGQTITVRQWPCQQPGQVCACAERRRRYMRSYEAIAAAGRRAVLAVMRVAVRGEEICGADELVYLRAGLDAAQRHLGLNRI